MAASTRLVATVFGATVLAAAMLTLASCESSTTPPSQDTSTHADALAGASAWLRAAAVPFDRVDPADNLDDLEPLRGLVGDARIVSLGEARTERGSSFR